MKTENKNAYELIAIISKLLRARGESKEGIDKVLDDMKSGDYSHLVAVYRSLTAWSK